MENDRNNIASAAYVIEKEVLRLRDFNRTVNSCLIEILQEQYENEKNPLFVWEAYQIARQWDIPLPDWVLKYLDDAAEGLLYQPVGEKTLDVVFQALKIPTGRTGQGTIFSQFEKLKLGYRIVYTICSLRKEKPNLTLEETFAEVQGVFKNEEIGDSGSNLKKWYDKLKAKATLVSD